MSLFDGRDCYRLGVEEKKSNGILFINFIKKKINADLN